MKRRLLLSALSCVLALGLVSACNDEEEDLSGGDMGTQTDGGGSGGGDTSGAGGDGTTDPGTKEAVTLTNYTVSFSFVDEDGEATTLEEGATLYIIGDWDGWGEFLECSEAEGVYSYTFKSIEAGTYEFKGVAVPEGEDPAYGYTDDETKEWVSWDAIDGGSSDKNASVTISESDTADGHVQSITIGPDGTIALAEGTYTYRFALYNSKSEAIAIPSGYSCYLTGGFNNWTLDEDLILVASSDLISETSIPYYEVVLDYVPVDCAYNDLQIAAVVDGETLDWSGVIWKSSNYVFPTDAADGYVEEHDVYLDFESFEAHFSDEGKTEFYVVCLDQATTSSISNLTSVKYQTTGWADEYLINGEVVGTLSTGTTSSGVSCVYTPAAKAEVGSSHVCYLYADDENGNWTHQLEIKFEDNSESEGDDLTIPETADGTFAVYLCAANSGYMSNTEGETNWGTWTDFGNSQTGGWITGLTGTIDSYVSSLDVTLASEGS